ncbi:unnamed protein product [Anisakis simplex]|uniref:Secreted protein n=1 Tax=Anisakis simplex TaxID=6269 RepID=A0A0M3J032_ANISI|nr:unnamed protein product [Anisakis simplex]
MSLHEQLRVYKIVRCFISCGCKVTFQVLLYLPLRFVSLDWNVTEQLCWSLLGPALEKLQDGGQLAYLPRRAIE